MTKEEEKKLKKAINDAIDESQAGHNRSETWDSDYVGAFKSTWISVNVFTNLIRNLREIMNKKT
jgi:hypothetical protein